MREIRKLSNIKQLLVSRKRESQPAYSYEPVGKQQPSQQPQTYDNTVPFSPSDISIPYEIDGNQVNRPAHTIPRRAVQPQCADIPQWSHPWDPASVETREEQERRMTEQREQEILERRQLEKRDNASAKSIRKLRALVREKYRLDLWIWGQRDVMEDERDLIRDDCRTSDILLERIYHVVNLWGENDFAAEEWQVAEMIQESVRRGEKSHTHWTSLAPWDREDDGEDEDEENGDANSIAFSTESWEQ